MKRPWLRHWIPARGSALQFILSSELLMHGASSKIRKIKVSLYRPIVSQKKEFWEVLLWEIKTHRFVWKHWDSLSKYRLLTESNSLTSSILVYYNPSVYFLLFPGGPALDSRPENNSRTFQSSWQQAQKQIYQHCGLWVSLKIWLWCLLLRNPIMF